MTGEVVFGLHPVLLALKTGRRELFSLHVRGSKLKDIGRSGASSLWTEILGLAEQRGLAPRRSSLANLDHLTENRTHQVSWRTRCVGQWVLLVLFRVEPSNELRSGQGWPVGRMQRTTGKGL